MLERQKPPVLEPGIQKLLEAIAAAKMPDLATIPLAEARRLARDLRLPWKRGGPSMAQTKEGELAGLRYRLHRPAEAGAAHPVFLFLFGGGWSLFVFVSLVRL